MEQRIAFARCVLRLEHIAEFLGVETRAGKVSASGRYVHEFREVNRHPDDEAKTNEPDENIFDDDDAAAATDAPAWAAALLSKLDALPRATTELLMGEVAEGNRLRKEDGKKRAHQREGGTASPVAQHERHTQRLPPPTTLPPPSSETRRQRRASRGGESAHSF